MNRARDVAHWLRPRVRQTILRALRPWTERQDQVRVAIGRIESRQVRSAPISSLREAEFRVYSQFGEDGILQYLTTKVPITNATFVEFGVEDYRESNTRFLLESDGWSGLILDAGTAHAEFVNHPRYRWRYPIDAVSAFVTRENINDLIGGANVKGDIGVLSIDIDGNDYWIWQAIDVVDPRIVVAEYNSVFGAEAAVTVPYDPAFDRRSAHPSTLYFGASLGALCHLAHERGFVCVGCTSAGNNAFFVRRDLARDLPELSSKEAYVRSRFREAHDAAGRRTFVDSHGDGLRAIRTLPVVDVRTGVMSTVAEAVGG